VTEGYTNDRLGLGWGAIGSFGGGSWAGDGDSAEREHSRDGGKAHDADGGGGGYLRMLDPAGRDREALRLRKELVNDDCVILMERCAIDGGFVS
jgi:hypothetical protein